MKTETAPNGEGVLGPLTEPKETEEKKDDLVHIYRKDQVHCGKALAFCGLLLNATGGEPDYRTQRHKRNHCPVCKAYAEGYLAGGGR